MLKFFKIYLANGTGIMLLYLFSVVALGSFVIGPLSVRVYATVLMLIYILVNVKRFKATSVVPISKSYIKLYVAFLLIFFVCLVITGDLMNYGFFKRFLAYDLVCITTFFAIYLKVNNKDQFKCILYFLLILCLFNSCITLLQITGQDIGWTIGQYIAPVDEAKDIADTHEGLLAISFAPGIFSHVVSNAFILASFSPLALFLSKRKGIVMFILMTCIYLVVIFLTQQRAAFYLYLLSLIISLFALVVKKPRILILMVLIICSLGTQLIDFFIGFDFGRLASGQDDSRFFMFKYAMEFIPKHFLFGGVSEFTRVTKLSAHNIILDSFIFAGIGGFITLMLFNIKVGLLCAKNTLSFVKGKCSLMTFSLTMAMTTCTLYGFTHNTSVLTGDVVVFILLALLLKSIKIDKIL